MPQFRYFIKKKDLKLIGIHRDVHASIKAEADKNDITMQEQLWIICRDWFQNKYGKK